MIIVLCFLLVGLNLVQTYQYHNKIISSWDMNFKKYRYTFLKTSDKYKNSLGGNNDIFPYKANEKSIYKKTVDFENKMKNIEFGKTKREDNSLICDYTNSKYNFSLFFKFSNPSLVLIDSLYFPFAY